MNEYLFNKWIEEGKISPEKRDLIIVCHKTNKKISNEEWEPMRANSYERFFLYEFLEDAVLINTIDYCIKNSSFYEERLGSTYDDVLLGRLLPILLKRFKVNHLKSICEDKPKRLFWRMW